MSVFCFSDMSLSNIASLVTRGKERFILSLRNLLVSLTPTRPISRDFFFSLFDFCRLSADSKLPIVDQLNKEEKKEIASNFRNGLPIIEKALVSVHCGLDPSVVHNLKQVRSSIQFLADDFGFLNEFDEEQQPSLSELLKNILKWDRVEMIDEELPDWEEGGGEFYVPPDPIDLTNIPKSHTWWTDADRSRPLA